MSKKESTYLLLGLRKCEFLTLKLKSFPQKERRTKLKFEEFKELFTFDLNEVIITN